MDQINTISIPLSIAYWLVPVDFLLMQYQTIVSDLAARFSGPNFVPHVPIYFGSFDPYDPVDEILETLSEVGELELHTKALEFTDQGVQSCFLQFENSRILSKMCELVRKIVHRPEPYQVTPRMNLFFGDLSSADRNAIRDEILVPEKVNFDLVLAVANSSNVVSQRDVESWYEISRFRLSACRSI